MLNMYHKLEVKIMLETNDSLQDKENRDVFDSFYQCVTTCYGIEGEDIECVTKCITVHFEDDSKIEISV